MFPVQSTPLLYAPANCEYKKCSKDRENWSCLFSIESLRRGSLKIDLKTLVRTIPRIIRNKQTELPPEWIEWDDPVKLTETFSITWIGHATFLIQVDGLNILIDPFWSDYKFGSVTLYKRYHPLPIDRTKIPTIHMIAITHNHVDHCEEESLRFFLERDNPLLCVPDGNGGRFSKMGFSHIEEFQWGDSIEFSNAERKVKAIFLPAAHDGDDKTLWGSWLFKSGDYSLYHAGDTGDAKHFEAIAERFKIDVALMPIAPYTMRDLQQAAHIDQEEAVRAFSRLKGRVFIPMHCCTLPYCDDDPVECMEKMQLVWERFQNEMNGSSLLVCKFGKRYSLKDIVM